MLKFQVGSLDLVLYCTNYLVRESCCFAMILGLCSTFVLSSFPAKLKGAWDLITKLNIIHGIKRRIKNVKLFPFIPFSLAHSMPKLSSYLIFIIHRLLVL